MPTGQTLQTVEFGSLVEVELIDVDGNCECVSFTIVQEAAADIEQNLVSEQAPLAKAILAKPVGKVVPYEMGDIRSLRIMSARPASVKVTADAQQRRQAVQQKALEKAERTNAEMFAASFSGKWGDYNLSDDQA